MACGGRPDKPYVKNGLTQIWDILMRPYIFLLDGFMFFVERLDVATNIFGYANIEKLRLFFSVYGSWCSHGRFFADGGGNP